MKGGYKEFHALRSPKKQSQFADLRPEIRSTKPEIRNEL